MECIINKSDEKPFLYSKNKIVIEVNEEFVKLSGYTNNELIGKSLDEMSSILKIDSQVYIENIVDECSCYLFTKEYEPKEVVIKSLCVDNKSEKIHYIMEVPNSNINDKFLYLQTLYSSNEISVAIYSLPDLIILKMNDKYLNDMDAPYNKRENVIGKKRTEIAPGLKDSETEKILLDKVKTGKPTFQKEFKYDYFERGTTYWDVSLVPIFLDGKEKYLAETTTDCTENVVNRNIINKQKEEIKAVINNVYDQIILINKNGECTKVNKMAKENPLYGFAHIKDIKDVYEQAEYFDINGNIILSENMPMKRVIRGEKISGDIIIAKNKNETTYTEVTGTPIFEEAGEFTGGVMIYHDVTAGVKNQGSLLQKNKSKSLIKILNNLELGCAITSYPDFKINYINNKSYVRLKKINPKIDLLSLVENNLFDIFEYSNEERDKIEKKLKKSIEKKLNSYFYYKDHINEKEEKYLKIMCQALPGLDDVITEVIFVAVDITDEVKAKNKIKDTLKIQDEIFSNISHELKTPLNLIFSTNQLMQFYLNNNLLESNKDKVSKNINIIKQNCNRFTKIINNIIDISKIESGLFKLNLSNHNIVNVIEEIVESTAEYIKVKKLDIVFDTNTEEKIIACDSDKIERIMLNLISNAVKFTEANGSIFVDIMDKGDTVQISVKDTGIGMDDKHLKSIFKRFHQIDKSLSRNAEGSGIGLSLVRSLVEIHGGEISADSKLDEGSIFIIELPSKIIEYSNEIQENKTFNSKLEMIDIEFSDIYTIEE